MPKGGFYFDAICRQAPIVEEKLDPRDNLVDFGILSEADVKHYGTLAERAAAKNKGAILTAPGCAFGDIALVPATWMKHTPGIREIEEWYVSTVIRRDYVWKVFEGQCEIALKNLALLANAIGDKVQAVFLTGTDFGTQRGPFIAPQAYRDLFKPFHKTINDLCTRTRLEDLHSLVRQRGGTDSGLYRCGIRHPQPGAVLGRGNGRAGSQGPSATA
jgi:hypothetical protein